MAIVKEVEKIILERFARDRIIAVATSVDNVPYVRNVDAFYDEGSFYFVTFKNTDKTIQMEQNPNVAIAGEWFTAHGVAINLGTFDDEVNKEIVEKIRIVFAEFIDDFKGDEIDIIQIKLTKGVLNVGWEKYDIDFDD